MEQPAYPPPAWGWPPGVGRAASSPRRRIRRTALVAAIATGLCFGVGVGTAYLSVAANSGESAWLMPLLGFAAGALAFGGPVYLIGLLLSFLCRD